MLHSVWRLARANGSAREFLYWSKVAAEVARISPRAEMSLSKVQSIVDEELRRNGGTQGSAG